MLLFFIWLCLAGLGRRLDGISSALADIRGTADTIEKGVQGVHGVGYETLTWIEATGKAIEALRKRLAPTEYEREYSTD